MLQLRNGGDFGVCETVVSFEGLRFVRCCFLLGKNNIYDFFGARVFLPTFFCWLNKQFFELKKVGVVQRQFLVVFFHGGKLDGFLLAFKGGNGPKRPENESKIMASQPTQKEGLII